MQGETIHPHRTLAQAPLLALHEVVWCRQSPASQIAIDVHEEEELQFCEQLQQQQQCSSWHLMTTTKHYIV